MTPQTQRAPQAASSEQVEEDRWGVGRFLNPQSIALLGASPDEHKLRGKITHYLDLNKYRGRLYFINPTHKTINGRDCLPDIGSVPEAVDLAIIVVPAPQVMGALQDCASAGARNAIIMTSGFAEEGGDKADLQQEIAAIGRRSGMRICGPNAEGFHNVVESISATFSPTVEIVPDPMPALSQKRLGVIAQSGGLGFALFNRGTRMGLQFSQIVTVGNECDLTVGNFLGHMADDPETSVILMFLEAVRQPDLFVEAARQAAANGKTVIVIRAGRSDEGKAATASHTGALASSSSAYEAAFRRHGIIGVDDLDAALAIAALALAFPKPKGRRVGVVTVSGGAGAMVTDALVEAGFTVPELKAETQAAIRALIPSYGATRNPVDVTGQATRTGAPLKVIEMLSAGDEVDIVVMASTMSNETRPPVDPDGLRAVVAQQRKPVAFYTYTYPSTFGLRALASAGCAPFTSAKAMGEALAALLRHAPAPADGQTLGITDIDLPVHDGALSERAAKELLSGLGVPVPKGRLVPKGEDAATIASGLAFPMVAKIQSPDILHKTEIGGVRLGIADTNALAVACQELTEAAARAIAGARIEGVLVEEMAGAGVELIVGCVRDETFGPVLTVGLGGTTTELFSDVSRRLAPVSEQEAEAMLRELKSWPLLEGYRGAPARDVASACRAIAAMSRLAAAEQRIAEIEINPLRVHDAGVTALDALVVLKSR